MKKLLLTMLFLCLSIVPAQAQTFSVSSTNPTDGSVNASQSTIVSISFTKAVDLDTANWVDFISYEPYDSVIVDDITYSTDQKTVRFHVSQSADTDFNWFIFDAISKDGERLDNTHIFTYSTSPNLGSYQVTGTISANTSSTQSLQTRPYKTPSFDHPNLERLIVNAADAHQLSSAAKLKVSGKSIKQTPSYNLETKLQETDFTKTLVMLVKSDYFLTDTTGGDVAAATVVNASSGDYTADYVRNGVYWPIVLKYDEADFVLPFQFGYYDPDQDQDPDSIVVQGQNLSGIDMQLFSMEPFSASEGLDHANELAFAAYSDNELKLIQGYEYEYDSWIFTEAENRVASTASNQLTGKSQFWTYMYYSPSVDSLTTVSLMPGNISYTWITAYDDLSYLEDPTQMKSIPATLINSTDAMATAETNGGAQFRNSLSDDSFLLVQMTGGHRYTSYPADSTPSAPIFWEIFYYAFAYDTTTGYPEFNWMSIFVDMETGELLDKTSTHIENNHSVLPVEVHLGQNYPNPFNPVTSIPFTLSQTQHVKISIYNVLGHPVMDLTNQMYPAGHHIISWDATDFSSGIYFYRLTAGPHSLVRKLVLLK